MSDGNQNTGGNVEPTTTVATQTTTAAVAPADTGVQSNVQTRIDGITAQKNEWQKKFEESQTALAEEQKKNQSEQEKAMNVYADQKLEQFKLTEHDPLTASADEMKGALQTQVDHYKGLVPEEKLPLLAAFDKLPLVQQLGAYQAFASGMDTNTTPPAIDGSGNPAPAATGKRWTRTEIRAINGDPVKWREHREDILAAQAEGRVDWDN